jgi:xanthine dehydrogenase accessory factor
MSLYHRISEIISEGRSVAVATVVRTQGSVPRRAGTKMLVFRDGQIEGTIGGGDMESQVIQQALEALSSGDPRTLTYAFRDLEKGDVGVCGGEMEVFVEPINPDPTVLVIGGGHVGKAVAHLSKWLGMRVIVADDRAEFAIPEAVPDADQYYAGHLSDLPDHVLINGSTYIVMTTRGVAVDVDSLPVLLDTAAPYIGVIGSRRRWEVTAKELLSRGVPHEKIEKVTSPMGLELNAETPEEIALSMLAEIVMLQRGGTGEAMKHSVHSEPSSRDT